MLHSWFTCGIPADFLITFHLLYIFSPDGERGLATRHTHIVGDIRTVKSPVRTTVISQSHRNKKSVSKCYTIWSWCHACC